MSFFYEIRDHVNRSTARSSFRYFYHKVQVCKVQVLPTEFDMKHKLSFADFEAEILLCNGFLAWIR